ncbi:MAG TPA: hypothetical protein DDZ96_03420 [Porphyromonadaceae bacterium]|nr:hypothetical protein [Porphyromonadaceae bacterium]
MIHIIPYRLECINKKPPDFHQAVHKTLFGIATCIHLFSAHLIASRKMMMMMEQVYVHFLFFRCCKDNRFILKHTKKRSFL